MNDFRGPVPGSIIEAPASGIRKIARMTLKGNWANAIAAVLLFVILIQVPVLLLNGAFGVVEPAGTSYPGQPITAEMAEISKATPVSQIYLLLVVGPFTLGLTQFVLAMFRKQDASPTSIFGGFQYLGKAVGLALVMGVFVFLWMLLFVIPGIIAMFRYSQAFFILADDPNKPIMMCIRESKVMMMGNKMKYFCLELSFIGWYIISYLPTTIVFAIINPAVTYWTYAGISLVMTLCTVPVMTYLLMSTTAFYEMLTGRLIFKSGWENTESQTGSVEEEDIQ